MKLFVETKLIKAEPEERDGQAGYKVMCPDGYISWSPKSAFEEACRELTKPEHSLLDDAAAMGVSGAVMFSGVALSHPFGSSYGEGPVREFVYRFPIEKGFYGVAFPVKDAGGHELSRPVTRHELQLARQSEQEESVSMISDGDGAVEYEGRTVDPELCQHPPSEWRTLNLSVRECKLCGHQEKLQTRGPRK